jgi:hypothetical protein
MPVTAPAARPPRSQCQLVAPSPLADSPELGRAAGLVRPTESGMRRVTRAPAPLVGSQWKLMISWRSKSSLPKKRIRVTPPTHGSAPSMFRPSPERSSKPANRWAPGSELVRVPQHLQPLPPCSALYPACRRSLSASPLLTPWSLHQHKVTSEAEGDTGRGPAACWDQREAGLRGGSSIPGSSKEGARSATPRRSRGRGWRRRSPPSNSLLAAGGVAGRPARPLLVVRGAELDSHRQQQCRPKLSVLGPTLQDLCPEDWRGGQER